ncbi:MAG: hypothetical protein HYW86_03835 [Candidatus Roizmanbacteria bacterium]|nr:MAG: hypothetical protein HYW86_03835 [Candidatus Roizmanbacteria bacterium]
MTIEKARKIIGVVSEKMTDTQIQLIIDCFDALIEVGFQQFEEKNKLESCSFNKNGR